MTTLPEAEIRSVILREYESTIVDCTPQAAGQMHAEGHVSVSPSFEPGRYEVRAKHKVGVLRYGDLELRVLPKVPVARLLYLAGFHRDPDGWRAVAALLDAAADPLSAIAEALVFHAGRALRPSPLQGYVTHEEAERRIRGRVLFEKQLSRRAGVVLPVELRYDEFEANIVENRVLKAAILEVELLVAEVSLRHRLRHLRLLLDGVEPWPKGRPIPTLSFGRLNRRYESALVLARLVLENQSLEYPERRRAGTAFLFDMNRLFEAFLESALSDALLPLGGTVIPQQRIYLDGGERLLMKPDLSWWRGGECSAVIDAKYKRVMSDEFPNADAYQMLAYCTRLGLARGYLVYADLDGSAPHTAVVRNAAIEIVVAALDVSGSVAEIGASVERLAALIADPRLASS